MNYGSTSKTRRASGSRGRGRKKIADASGVSMTASTGGVSTTLSGVLGSGPDPPTGNQPVDHSGGVKRGCPDHFQHGRELTGAAHEMSTKGGPKPPEIPTKSRRPTRRTSVTST